MRIAIIVMTACSSSAPKPTPPAPPAPSPPYAVTDKLSEPRLFAPGAVSTELPEFSIAFSADGATAYFDRAPADRSKFEIVASHFTDGAWQPAQSLTFSTGEFRDVDPFVAGDRLYFSSNRPHPGTGETDFDTWYVTRHGGTWSEPAHVDGAASGPGNQIYVSIAHDGTLFFQSDATGGGDIYRAASIDAPSASSIDAIDTPESEGNPAVSPDGTLLVFVAERPGGLGGSDLYGSRFRDGTWTSPKLLTAASSPQADFAPAFSPDGKYLFFTSERPGVVPAPASCRPPGDIYQIEVAALGI